MYFAKLLFPHAKGWLALNLQVVEFLRGVGCALFLNSSTVHCYEKEREGYILPCWKAISRTFQSPNFFSEEVKQSCDCQETRMGLRVLELNISGPAVGTYRHRHAHTHPRCTHIHTHNPRWSRELVSGGLTKCFLHMLFCQAAQLLGLQK